jgi:hypothetical protein
MIEDVLKVLGIDNVSILYSQLQRLGISPDEIIDRPSEFSSALRTIFGQGAAILEKQIISLILSKTTRPYGNAITLSEAFQLLKG